MKFKKQEVIPSDAIGIINLPVIKGKDELVEINQADELVIQMVMLLAETVEDESQLVEITDSEVLEQINNLVRGLAQA